MTTIILKSYSILIVAFEVDHVFDSCSREFKLLFKLHSLIKAIKGGCFLCDCNMIYVVRKFQTLVVSQTPSHVSITWRPNAFLILIEFLVSKVVAALIKDSQIGIEMYLIACVLNQINLSYLFNIHQLLILNDSHYHPWNNIRMQKLKSVMCV